MKTQWSQLRILDGCIYLQADNHPVELREIELLQLAE